MSARHPGILIELTHEEREQLKADAAAAGYPSMREYVEMRLLGRLSRRRETTRLGRRPRSEEHQEALPVTA